MSEIREPNFSIDLPGEWEQAEGDEPGTTTYREQDGDASMSVTLLAVRPMFAIADQRRLLDDYMTHRSTFEQGQVPTMAQMAPASREADGRFEGAWDAVDVANARRARHRVVLVEGLLADFRYEGPGDDESAFVERADSVLGTVTVTPAESSDSSE